MLQVLLIIIAMLIIILLGLVILVMKIKVEFFSSKDIRLLSINEIGYIIQNDNNNGVDVLKYYYDWRFKFNITIMTIFTSLFVGLLVVFIRQYNTLNDWMFYILLIIIGSSVLIIIYILFRLKSIPNEYIKSFKSFYELKEDLES